MARKKSFRVVGKFILRQDGKSNVFGESPIYIQYCLDRKVAKSNTGVWIQENDWDQTLQMVKGSHPMADDLNKAINQIKNSVDLAILNYSIAGNTLTIDILRQMVTGTFSEEKEPDTQDFIKFVEHSLLTRYQTGEISVSTYENQRSAMRYFKRFIQHEFDMEELPMSDFSENIIDRYIIWRKKERDNCEATINKSLAPIIRASKSAVAKGLISHELSDLISTKYLAENKKMSRSEDEDSNADHYLTEDQVHQLIKLAETVKYPRTRDYIDMFLFSVNACGLRFSDLVTLEWRHIDFNSHHLKKILVKGRVQHRFLLNRAAEAILLRWKERTGNHRFVFGLLPDNFDIDDDREVRRMRINKNTPVKTSLKTIGQKMGLKFNLTMHVARHTFAVTAINRGVDIHVISVLLAHSSVLVTEKVYAKFLPKKLDDEIRDKLDFDFI